MCESGGRSTAAHYRNFVRILSTAGFITPPEGEAEVVQGIFVDREVARIV